MESIKRRVSLMSISGTTYATFHELGYFCDSLALKNETKMLLDPA